MSGRCTTALPTSKNVPRTPYCSRMLAMSRVNGGLGPSSNVTATSFDERGPWLCRDPNHVTVGAVEPTQKIANSPNATERPATGYVVRRATAAAPGAGHDSSAAMIARPVRTIPASPTPSVLRISQRPPAVATAAGTHTTGDRPPRGKSGPTPAPSRPATTNADPGYDADWMRKQASAIDSAATAMLKRFCPPNFQVSSE